MHPLMPAAFEEHDQVDDEEQDDGDFEHEHVAVVAVGLEELVEVVEGFEFFVGGFVPVADGCKGFRRVYTARRLSKRPTRT